MTAAAEYDVFLSHAWADGEPPNQIADAPTKAGLRVWFDAVEIDDFASITRAVTEGLAKSKALVAYYSKTYPLRRACQWELTAAYLSGQAEGDPRERVPSSWPMPPVAAALAGVGKSLLAEEYALRFGAAYPGGIFWMRAFGNDDAKAALGAEERDALRADQVQLIAERLGIRTEGLKAAEIEGELGHKIAREGKTCLWVVDDVPAGINGTAPLVRTPCAGADTPHYPQPRVRLAGQGD